MLHYKLCEAQDVTREETDAASQRQTFREPAERDHQGEGARAVVAIRIVLALPDVPPQPPFHLRVVAPADAAVYRPLIERVIVAEKPAYATYELVFATGATPARATGRKGVSR